MIICSQQVFDKFYLDIHRDDPYEFIDYISQTVERELVNKLVGKFKDHKPYIVKLREPRLIEDVPEYRNAQCAYRQELEYREVIQCKDCRMVYPWCQKFRDELGGNGFCPYGKPAEVLNIGFNKAKADIAKWSMWSKTYEAMCESQTERSD